MIKSNKNIIYLSKILLSWILIISIIFEMIFYPSLENLCGCIMMIISYFIFVKIFLNQKKIVNFPFSFMMFLSMFMYRYLPLPVTLLERKPVSYGMEMPLETFFFETILYIVSCMAFYFATYNSTKNNILQKFLNKFRFYDKGNESLFWRIGMLGFIIRIITFSMGDIATGNVIGKILLSMINFMYFPIVLFFPCFYKESLNEKINFRKPLVWIYIIIISILNLAANSRNMIITPVATIVLLNLLYLCINNVNLSKILKPKKVVLLAVLIIGGIKILSIVSDSILSTRSVRDEVSFTELIELTYTNIINSDLQGGIQNSDRITTYDQGWTEEYIDNYLLNRYANMRITDETLYLRERLGSYGHIMMQKDMINRIICLLPQPVIDILGLGINKNNYLSSRGDILYVYSGIGNSYSLGGYRVTSHVGDGVSTFGYLYFALQFIVFFVVFKLLNSFVYYDKKEGRKYSIYALLSLYTFLGMFRNANGIMSDINFILRGYWQDVIIFILIFNLIRFISRIRIRM